MRLVRVGLGVQSQAVAGRRGPDARPAQMTPEQQKEELSKAYLLAVAARCGFAVGTWSQDHGGVDATVSAGGTVGGGARSRPKIDVQLKCTAQQSLLREEFLSWTLERAHYDGLRHPACDPHILVVLLLPEREDEWLEHGPDRLILRRCAWWVCMTGMPEREGDSVTVRLPREQVFSPDQLRLMMTRVSRGGSP